MPQYCNISISFSGLEFLYLLLHFKGDVLLINALLNFFLKPQRKKMLLLNIILFSYLFFYRYSFSIEMHFKMHFLCFSSVYGYNIFLPVRYQACWFLSVMFFHIFHMFIFIIYHKYTCFTGTFKTNEIRWYLTKHIPFTFCFLLNY